MPGVSVDEMKLEKDPSVSKEIEELLSCFDLLTVDDVDFERRFFRRKETDDELRMWFDMPGLRSDDVSIIVMDKTTMIITSEGYPQDVDGSLNGDGRIRMYGGVLYFPPNHFDLDQVTTSDFKMKNGVLKVVVVVPNLKLEESTDALLPNVKLEERTGALPPNLKLEESTDALLPNVKKQKIEESTDVFFVNVECDEAQDSGVFRGFFC